MRRNRNTFDWYRQDTYNKTMNYILHGTDTSRIEQRMEAIKRKHDIQQALDFDCQQTEQAMILHEMDSLSIFDEKKMIVLHHCTFLAMKDTTKYDIEAFIKRTDASDQLIMVFCADCEKLYERRKTVKKLASLSTVYACMPLDDQSRRSFVIEKAKAKGMQLDRQTLDWICSRIGYDSLHIESEIEVKHLFKKPTVADCQQLITPEPTDNIFKMVDALFSRNALLLLSYYRNFRQQNMEPVAIVALLAGQIRFLFQVHVYLESGKSQAEIAKILHAHPYRVKINAQRAQNFTSQELMDQLVLLATFDQEMKRGQVDKDDGFEQFVLKMLEA